LIEVGFLSNDADLLALQDPATRNRFVGGILRGVLLWSISEAKTDARRLR
jgi:N-acetylmuramoyl-L-alanine amidase